MTRLQKQSEINKVNTGLPAEEKPGGGGMCLGSRQRFLLHKKLEANSVCLPRTSNGKKEAEHLET